MTLQVEEVITFQRTLTQKDVELFTKISGDEGIHHIASDEQERLVV